MPPIGATLYALDVRGPLSRRVVVDAEGVMLGPDCILVRRTPAGYRCANADEAERIQNVLRHQFEAPGWLFQQCCRIAKALADGYLALAQIYGLFIRTKPLDADQIIQLASIARVAKANFNPDEPRDAHGRWTDLGDADNNAPASQSPPAVRDGNPATLLAPPVAHRPQRPPAAARPGQSATIISGYTRPATTQLAADNTRQNKMVRDIVVRLKLTPDQQERLHREISGRGLAYHEILEEAKDMFDK